MSDVETHCLRWTGAHDGSGYGAIWLDSRVQRIHVVSYDLVVGPIPDGFQIDHVWDRGCRYRDCFLPEHLEAVTQAENIRRMGAKTTHCVNGHRYTDKTTYVRKDGNGRRGCRICRAEQAAASHARRAAS